MRADAATLRHAAIPSAGVVTDAVLIALGAGCCGVGAGVDRLSVHPGADRRSDIRSAASRCRYPERRASGQSASQVGSGNHGMSRTGRVG